MRNEAPAGAWTTNRRNAVASCQVVESVASVCTASPGSLRRPRSFASRTRVGSRGSTATARHAGGPPRVGDRPSKAPLFDHGALAATHTRRHLCSALKEAGPGPEGRGLLVATQDQAPGTAAGVIGRALPLTNSATGPVEVTAPYVVSPYTVTSPSVIHLPTGSHRAGHQWATPDRLSLPKLPLGSGTGCRGSRDRSESTAGSSGSHCGLSVSWVSPGFRGAGSAGLRSE